jgi:hypothetical protein
MSEDIYELLNDAGVPDALFHTKGLWELLATQSCLLSDWNRFVLPLLDGWCEAGSGHNVVAILLAVPESTLKENAEEYVRFAQRGGHMIEHDLLTVQVYPPDYPLCERWNEPLQSNTPDKRLPALIQDANASFVLLNMGERLESQYLGMQRIVSADLLPNAEQQIGKVVSVKLLAESLPDNYIVESVTLVEQKRMPPSIDHTYALLWRKQIKLLWDDYLK